MKQGWYESAVHSFQLLYQYSQRRPLASRLSAPRTSTNDAFSPSRCVVASFLIRIHSCRRQLVACTSASIFLTSLSLADIFSKSDKKRSITRVYLICSPLKGAVLKAVHRIPGSLECPSIAALATLLPPIRVFSVLSPSFAALSIIGIWAVNSTALPIKPPKLCPAVFQTGVVVC